MPQWGKQAHKEYYENNKSKLIYQNWIRQIKRLGCSPEMYEKLLKEQNGLCAICHGTNYDSRRLAVDHCKKTKKVRGLLCQRCNTALGLFKDKIELLESALSYLIKSKE